MGTRRRENIERIEADVADGDDEGMRHFFERPAGITAR